MFGGICSFKLQKLLRLSSSEILQLEIQEVWALPVWLLHM